MKVFIFKIVLLGAYVIFAGCAVNDNAIVKASANERHDVFKQTNIPPPGKAVLNITFPVKTYKARLFDHYFKHNKPEYTAIFNIDGQSTILSAEPKLEEMPGDFKNDPEVGTGFKYDFKCSLVIAPGKHHLIVVLPISNVVLEKDIVLKSGENKLELSPIYNSSVSRYRGYPRFNHGIHGISAKLNNQNI